MELQTERPDEKTLVLHLSGRFDAHTVGSVKNLWLADEKIRFVIADLATTTFVDSIALSTLVSGLKTARLRAGEFILANPSEVVRVILELTSLDRVFKSATSVEEGLRLVATRT